MKYSCQVLLFNNPHITERLDNVGPYVDIIHAAYPYYSWNKKEENVFDLKQITESKRADKVRIIYYDLGQFKNEQEIRTDLLHHAEVDGYDYQFVIDTDEFYEPGAIEQAKKQIETLGGIAFKSKSVTIWKSDWLCMRGSDPAYIYGTFCIKLNSNVVFDNLRETNIPATELDITCNHLSYTMSDEDMYKKVMNCIEIPSPQERYDKVWMNPDPESLRNFHSSNPPEGLQRTHLMRTSEYNKRSQTKKILIGMPNLGGIPPSMAKYLFTMEIPNNVSVSLSLPERLPIVIARNEIIRQAVVGGYDYILFLDDDNVPEQKNILEIMLGYNKDIVSGIVPSRGKVVGHHLLCIFDKHIDDLGKENYAQYMNMPKDELTKIEGCGMGCVLISRNVFQKVWDEYHNMPTEMRAMRYYQTDEGTLSEEQMDRKNKKTDGWLRYCKYVSEDILFFERAKSLGFDMYATKNVTCTHIGFHKIVNIQNDIIKGNKGTPNTLHANV